MQRATTEGSRPKPRTTRTRRSRWSSCWGAAVRVLDEPGGRLEGDAGATHGATERAAAELVAEATGTTTSVDGGDGSWDDRK
ncbi:hypothetical protein MTO96_030779 [Rhipicephalus appendiculatus]